MLCTAGAIHEHRDVVIPDGEIADLLSGSKDGERCGTAVVKRLHDRSDVLAPLEEGATSLGEDVSGWAWAEGFALDEPFPRRGQFLGRLTDARDYPRSMGRS
jgi:hypothetical protein